MWKIPLKRYSCKRSVYVINMVIEFMKEKLVKASRGELV